MVSYMINQISIIPGMHKILQISLIFLLLPVMGFSQQADLEAAMDRAVTAGVDMQQIEQIRQRAAGSVSDATLADIMAPIADLAEKDMPTEFMVQKVLEGFAKGIPSGRMKPVLDAIHAHTPRAVMITNRWVEKPDVSPFIQALGDQEPRFRNDLVNASLKSLTQQVSPEQIESVLNELGSTLVLKDTSPHVIAAAVGVLPDMPASMMNSAGIRRVIAKAIRGGFSAADIQKLPGAMNAAERRSQLPAASILSGMSTQIGNGIPANQVLQNLFNGNVNAGPPSGVPGRPDGRPGGKPDGRGQGSGNGNGGSGH